jgi:hypothetical protein
MHVYILESLLKEVKDHINGVIVSVLASSVVG